jgi:hypothetical protein
MRKELEKKENSHYWLSTVFSAIQIAYSFQERFHDKNHCHNIDNGEEIYSELIKSPAFTIATTASKHQAVISSAASNYNSSSVL